MIKKRGYTLVELVVSVGLFAVVMLLASGAYILMIGLNRQTQGMATGVDNLSFAIETMTRNIRTGTGYSCPGGTSSCTIDGNAAGFSFTSSDNSAMTYALSSGAITQDGAALTDPSVNVSSLMFYVVGTKNAANPPNDSLQPHVTITISGNVSPPGKPPQFFTIETGATMRGTDL